MGVRHAATFWSELIPISSSPFRPRSGGWSMATASTLAKPFKGTVEVVVQGTVTAANGALGGVNPSKIR